MNQHFVVAMAVILGLLAIGPCGVCAQGLNVTLRLRILPGEDVVLLADRDHDGKLSMGEMTDFAANFGISPSQEKLARFDMNHDGFLDVAELDEGMLFAGRNLIKILDDDGDGKLAMQEVEKRCHLLNNDILRPIDTNSDGYLSAEEIENVPEKVLMLMRQVPKVAAASIDYYLTNATKFAEKMVRSAATLMKGNETRSLGLSTLSLVDMENLLNSRADDDNKWSIGNILKGVWKRLTNLWNFIKMVFMFAKTWIETELGTS